MTESGTRPCFRYTEKSESKVNTGNRSWISAIRTRQASASDIGVSSYF
jgi:hypothetical protein